MSNLKDKIDNVDRAIDTVLHSDLIVHLIMIGAAVASFTNVLAFFSTDHGGVVATALAIILGLVLVVMSSKLSRLPINWADNDYKITAATTITFGLISGAVQTAIYSAHMSNMAAAALGFGLPLGFEVCLAFAVASYKRTMRTVAANDSRDRLADSMQDKFNSAIDHVDGEGMAEMFQDMADTVARELAQSLQAQMVRDIRSATEYTVVDDVQEAASSIVALVDNAANSKYAASEDASMPQDKAADMRDAKAQQSADKAAQIPILLADEGTMTTAALAAALAVSTDTVRRYCGQMTDSVESCGRGKWQLISA